MLPTQQKILLLMKKYVHFLHKAILISIVHYTLNIQMPLDLIVHPRLREIGLVQHMQHTQ